MEPLSNEAISGIVGAICGSAASFVFGALKEYHDNRNKCANAIRRTQFTIVRQTNELRDIRQKMEHMRHAENRHLLIQLIPKLGVLNQVRPEEIDFLVDEGHLSAQELQEIDTANSAYANSRYVNDLRNQIFGNFQQHFAHCKINDRKVTGVGSTLEDLKVKDITDNLFICLDDAISKCDGSIKVLLRAARSWRITSDTKFYALSTNPLNDAEWQRLSEARVDFKQIEKTPVDEGYCILETKSLNLSNNTGSHQRITVIIQGKASIGIVIKFKIIDAVEATAAAHKLGLSHYYWIHQGTLSLIDSSHTRPSVRCQIAGY